MELAQEKGFKADQYILMLFRNRDLSRHADIDDIIKPNEKTEICLFCLKKYGVLIYK